MDDANARRRAAQDQLRQIREDPALGALVDAVAALRDVSPLMPIQQAHTFLLIARHPRIGVSELLKRVGGSQSSMSRHLQALSTGGRSKDGLRLIECRKNPTDYRQDFHYLTASGRQLAIRLSQALGARRGRQAEGSWQEAQRQAIEA